MKQKKHWSPWRRMLAGALPLLAAGAAAAGTSHGLSVETQPGFSARPHGVEIESTADGVHVQGELSRVGSSPRRRLVGRVELEALDAEGNVLAAPTARPHRASPARHTRRAHFEARLAPLPEAAATLRVRYR